MEVRPVRRVERVRHEIRRRNLVVAATRQLGASFVEVTLTGDELAGFDSGSFDDHIKLLFPAAEGGEVVGRDYTPRRFESARQELVIEFLLHQQGVATDWARSAAPGTRLTVAGPRSSMIIPTDYDWHLLVGDETGLPAIARRMEELPPGARAIVLAQVDNEADRRQFQSMAQVETHWASTSQELLALAASSAVPQGDGFVWAAGEASVMSRLRTEFLVRRGHPREAARIAAYWKRGTPAHHEHLE